MGTIVRFPASHHGRASTGSRDARRDSTSVVTPAVLAASVSTMIDHHSAGMLPRDRQLLTKGGLRPIMRATAEVPPNASITSSIESNMAHPYSHIVNSSSERDVHIMPIVTDCELLPNVGMTRTLKDIARRLRFLEEALELAPSALADEAKIPRNQWSQFKNPAKKRRITIEAAYKLKDRFGIPLEFIYDDDRTRLPADIRDKLRRAEAA